MEHGSSSSPEVEALRHQVAELAAQLAEQRALIAEQQATIVAYQEQLERQREQLTLLKRALFGSRRERYVASPDQMLLAGFEPLDSSPEPSSVADEPPAEPPAAVAKSRRRPPKRFVFPEGLPRRRTEYPLAAAELPCSCCQQPRVVIGEHVSRQLELEPAHAYVAEHVRYTYACSKCRAGESLHTTAKPPLPIEKSPFGPSVLAAIGVDKYARHLPLYRQQESLLGPLQTWLSRSLMCRLLRGVAEALKPLVTRLRELIFISRVVQIDETTVRYLDRNSDRTQGGYFWAYAGDVHHRYVYYEFQSSRSRAGPAAWLSTYRGYVQSDGYSVYESLAKDATERWTHVGCWAHVRRKFDEALLTTSHPILHESLAAIQQLYALETQTATCSSADRQAQRAAHVRPIIERWHTRLLAVRDELRPSTKLAEAVNYALNRWPTLLRYLDDGDLSIDTNHVEREIRPLAIGRTNWLFLGNERAGTTASALYTVLQSARLQQVDLLPYLTDVLRGLPAVGSGDLAGLDVYLPDRWLAAHPQHRLIERERESQEAQRRRRVRHAARRAGTAG